MAVFKFIKILSKSFPKMCFISELFIPGMTSLMLIFDQPIWNLLNNEMSGPEIENLHFK